MKTVERIFINLLKSPIFWQFPGPILLIGKLLLDGKALYWGTVYLQFTPWRLTAWRMITQGIAPLWNDANGLGAPLMANYQTAFFYPPNWLLWIGAWIGNAAGIAWVQTLLVVTHLVLSGIGFVYMLRDLGMKPFTCAIGGMAFSLCGYQIARASFLSINSALVWLPWLLYVSHQWIRLWGTGDWQGAKKYILLHALFSAMQLLAGHAQVTWYTQLLIFLWVCIWMGHYSPRQLWIRQLACFAGASLFAAMLAFIQLLPTAEFLLQSQRASAVAYEYALNYSFWPWRAITLLVPNLFGNPGNGGYTMTVDNYWEDAIYVGLLPVIFAVLTLFYLVFRGKRLTDIHRITGWFATAITVIGFIFALGWRTPVFPFLYRNIPTFDIFQGPTRFSLWCEVGLILLACIGIDRWQKPTGKKLYWSNLGVMGAVTAVGTAIVTNRMFAGKVEGSFLAASLETAVIFFILALLNRIQPAAGGRRVVWRIIMTAVVCADLVFAGWYLNPGLALTEYQQADSGVHEGKLQYLSIADEYALKFNRFFVFNDFSQGKNWYVINNFMIPNSNLYQNNRSITSFDPFVPASYPDWVNFIETQTGEQKDAFLAWLGVDEVHRFANLYQSKPDILELSPELPFHFFGSDQVQADDGSVFETMEQLVQSGEYRERLIIEGYASDIGDQSEMGSATATISILENKPNQVRIAYESEVDGWILQVATYYPGWQAEVDGRAAVIYKADGYLRAVQVPAGRHELTIRYQPASYLIGLLVSCISWLVFGWVTIGSKRRLFHGR